MRLKAIALFLLAALILPLSSCGSELTDTALLDLPSKGILGMTAKELETVDPNLTDGEYTVTEKDMEDGSHRLKYVIVGDAFIKGGKWVTTVHYYLRGGLLERYEIEYRPSDYIEGSVKKRLTAITEYMTGLYGEPFDAKCLYDGYLYSGSGWTVDGATFDMARQNGGWILLSYHK